MEMVVENILAHHFHAEIGCLFVAATFVLDRSCLASVRCPRLVVLGRTS